MVVQTTNPMHPVTLEKISWKDFGRAISFIMGLRKLEPGTIR